ncbi:LysR family transcriptional regulator [Fulvimarina sp. MAC8]|uniref:LysR family transcriptional regulator n=1 Tax=Fulvimarina sp. MAC8 TaxID=3162874 RepID=UPI0032ED2DFA
MVEPRILSRLVYFSAVVETRSFTRAADRLGITKAVVSQQVSRLEEDLQTALLVRTTRRVEPTEAGRLLYERAAGVLREAGDAIAETAQSNTEPRGTLRILAPADYGSLVIVPVVADFLARYPGCTADLRLDDRIADILEGEIDLSIRVGWLADSSLHARRLGAFDQFLVAASKFRSETEALTSPEDLSALPLIANTALPDPTTWHFTHASGKRQSLEVEARLAVDTTRGVQAAALSGAGLAVLPEFAAADDIAAGRLIRVLPDWTLPTGGIHAVFPSARLRPKRVSAFVEMLSSALKSAANGGGFSG